MTTNIISSSGGAFEASDTLALCLEQRGYNVLAIPGAPFPPFQQRLRYILPVSPTPAILANPATSFGPLTKQNLDWKRPKSNGVPSSIHIYMSIYIYINKYIYICVCLFMYLFICVFVYEFDVCLLLVLLLLLLHMYILHLDVGPQSVGSSLTASARLLVFCSISTEAAETSLDTARP